MNIVNFIKEQGWGLRIGVQRHMVLHIHGTQNFSMRVFEVSVVDEVEKTITVVKEDGNRLGEIESTFYSINNEQDLKDSLRNFVGSLITLYSGNYLRDWQNTCFEVPADLDYSFDHLDLSALFVPTETHTGE